MKKKVILLQVILLFVISFVIIFSKFNAIPRNLSFDEVEFAQLAISLDKKPYLPYSPIAFGHSTVYFYIILFSFKLFGINNFALRFPSALFGIVSPLLLYLILTQFFKTKKDPLSSIFPFLSSLLLITSRWYITFSRFSFEATFLLFLELLSIYFLVKFLEGKKSKNLYICAFFAGLAFLSYLPGRIFFLLPLIFLLAKNLKKSIVVYLLVVAVVVSPLTFYLTKNPDYRVRELSVTKFIRVGENIKKTLFMFNFAGDMNGRHNFPGKPALNPILGFMFLFGLVLSIKNISKFSSQLMLSYFILSLIPTLLTVPKDNPNMLRTFTALPSIFYFSLLPVSFFLNLKSKFRNLIIFAFCFLFLASSVYELRTYFLYQSRVFRNAFEVKCNLVQVVGLKIQAIPKRCRVTKNEF